MALSEHIRNELLSFNSGEPIIVTPCSTNNDCALYSLTMFVRTIADPAPVFIKSVQLILRFPEAFPHDSPIVNLNNTQLFHPNFTADGEWASNSMAINETISDYIMRLVRNIQFKEIDMEHIANRNAMAWFNRKRDSGIFPTDIINYRYKPSITIYKINGE